MVTSLHTKVCLNQLLTGLYITNFQPKDLPRVTGKNDWHSFKQNKNLMLLLFLFAGSDLIWSFRMDSWLLLILVVQLAGSLLPSAAQDVSIRRGARRGTISWHVMRPCHTSQFGNNLVGQSCSHKTFLLYMAPNTLQSHPVATPKLTLSHPNSPSLKSVT